MSLSPERDLKRIRRPPVTLVDEGVPSVDVLGFLALVLVGFTACAEFGSYAFFHPVLRALDAAPRIRVEQGLLKTVGRAMPVLMPMSSLLVLAYAVFGPERGPVIDVLRWAAVPAMLVSVITTLLFNVPINTATARWDADNPPPDWERTRRRWEAFQGVRAWLLLVGFVLLALAVTL